ncbi:RPL4A [Scenedesmus sp. PABB004]|nr:RPL4A [Scenedesmus sp. PABB004]
MRPLALALACLLAASAAQGARVLQQSATQFKWVQLALSFKGTTCAELGGADFIDGLRIAGRNDMRAALITAGITGFNVRASSRDCVDTSIPSFVKLAQTLVVLSYNGTTNLEVRNALWNAARERICTGGYNRVVWSNVADYLANKDNLVAFNNASRLNPSGNSGANQMPYVPAAGGCGTPGPSPAPSPSPKPASPSPAPASPSPAPASPSPAPASPSPAPASPSPSPEPASPSPSPVPSPSPSPAPALNCSSIPNSVEVNGTCTCGNPSFPAPVLNGTTLVACLGVSGVCPVNYVAVRTATGALVQCLAGITQCPAGPYTLFQMAGNPLRLVECRPATSACVFGIFSSPVLPDAVSNTAVGCVAPDSSCPADYPVAFRTSGSFATIQFCRKAASCATGSAYPTPGWSATGQLLACLGLASSDPATDPCPSSTTNLAINFPTEVVAVISNAATVVGCLIGGGVCYDALPDYRLGVYTPGSLPVLTQCRVSPGSNCDTFLGGVYTTEAVDGVQLQGCIASPTSACPIGYAQPTLSGGNIIKCSKTNSTITCDPLGSTPVSLVDISGTVVGCSEQVTACPTTPNYPIAEYGPLGGATVIRRCLAPGSTCAAGATIFWGAATAGALPTVQQCWPAGSSCSGIYTIPVQSGAASSTRVGCLSTSATTTRCPADWPFTYVTIGDAIDRCLATGAVSTCEAAANNAFSIPARTINAQGDALVGCIQAAAPNPSNLCPGKFPVEVRAGFALVGGVAPLACLSSSSTSCPAGNPFFFRSASGLDFCINGNPTLAGNVQRCSAGDSGTWAPYTAVNYKTPGGVLQGCSTAVTVCAAGFPVQFRDQSTGGTLTECRVAMTVECPSAVQPPTPSEPPVNPLVPYQTTVRENGVITQCLYTGGSSSCNPPLVAVYTGTNGAAGTPATCLAAGTNACPTQAPFPVYGGSTSLLVRCLIAAPAPATGCTASYAGATATAEVYAGDGSIAACVETASPCPTLLSGTTSVPTYFFRPSAVAIDYCTIVQPTTCPTTGASTPTGTAYPTTASFTAGGIAGCLVATPATCPAGFSFSLQGGTSATTAATVERCLQDDATRVTCPVGYPVPLLGATASNTLEGCVATGPRCPTTYPGFFMSGNPAQLQFCKAGTIACNSGAAPIASFTVPVQTTFSLSPVVLGCIATNSPCLDGTTATNPNSYPATGGATSPAFGATGLNFCFQGAISCAGSYADTVYNAGGTAIGCVADAAPCPDNVAGVYTAKVGLLTDSTAGAAASSRVGCIPIASGIVCPGTSFGGVSTYTTEVFNVAAGTTATNANLVACVTAANKCPAITAAAAYNYPLNMMTQLTDVDTVTLTECRPATTAGWPGSPLRSTAQLQQGLDGAAAEQTALPAVFGAPIRPDIVRTVHTNMAKNRRQPYAVSMKAGHQTAAESWGTGRAVSRIPRVPGGGTHRAGQGAFGNMCRGGHMFAPTKTWRRWHRKINLNQKRYAVASALAATGLPALVMARGHRIEQVPEVPLVVSDAAEGITKTSKALELLRALGAAPDADKAKDSKALRRGKGKMRNRRHVLRKGPLVVYGADHGISKAFRNLPGVEVAPVDALNLLQLAPGGHLGRFVIFTRSAFDRLDAIFGTAAAGSAVKKGYRLPRSVMANADVTRLINSDEVQSVVNAPKAGGARHYALKKNPLKNLGAMVKLNPAAASARRSAILLSERRAVERAARLAKVRAGQPGGAPRRSAEGKALAKRFYGQMVVDSEYQGEDYEVFDKWLGTAQ